MVLTLMIKVYHESSRALGRSVKLDQEVERLRKFADKEQWL